MVRLRSIFALTVTLASLGCAGSTTSSGGGGNSSGGSGGDTGGHGGTGTGGAVAGSSGMGGTSGQSGSAGHGGSGVCTQDCVVGRTCCNGSCVNEDNDLHNCGACGKTCSDGTYCSGSQCLKTPCTATCSGGTCCGTECCSGTQLCCDPAGPLDNGPHCLEPSDAGTCPLGCAPLCVCAAPDTPIATPSGDRAIATLRTGDLVYSLEEDRIVVVPIANVRRTSVSGHHVRRVALENGVVLEISAGHPTADGRTFRDLRAGSELGGVRVTDVEKEPYEYPATYDILPASSTGAYFAGGALIGSTIDPSSDTDMADCVGEP